MAKGHKARKRFGQNFLTDSGIIQRIVETIHPQPGQTLVEIGPGQAALTRPLLESGADLQLVEIDRDLVALLQQRLATFSNFKLHNVDALQADFAEICGHRPFRLVGNLPYNISTPLLFHVLQWHELIEDMHFMLQQEVVNRMAAQPGSKAWGKLSVMCQYHCEVSALMTVPPESFSPAPRVQSAIVRLVPHRQPPVQINDMSVFQTMLQQVFSMRRKTLRNGLKGRLTPEQIESVGINPGNRPETVDLAGFAALANLLSGGDA